MQTTALVSIDKKLLPGYMACCTLSCRKASRQANGAHGHGSTGNIVPEGEVAQAARHASQQCREVGGGGTKTKDRNQTADVAQDNDWLHNTWQDYYIAAVRCAKLPLQCDCGNL